MKTIAAILTLSLASCGVPFTFGVSANGLEAEYSAKGGLVVVVEATGK